MTDIETLAEAVKSGDRPSVARAITILASEGGEGARLRERLGESRRSHRIGITGPAGVGKSTLIGALLPLFRSRGERVAVVACDPASPLSGGAFLGDRMRMSPAAEGDPGVFIRSIASRGPGADLPPEALAAGRVLAAGGFDRIIFETTGAGQCDVGLRGAVDTVVVVLPPEAGDEYQVLKAGLSETADILVVNRADRPGAEALLGLLEEEVDSRASCRRKPAVLPTTATRGEGVPALLEAIDAHRAVLSGRAGRETAGKAGREAGEAAAGGPAEAAPGATLP